MYALKLLLAGIALMVIGLALKKILGRPRPVLINPREVNLRSKENNCSLPSGDTLFSAALTTLLYTRHHMGFAFMLIPLVAFARIYYQCHWIGDTVFGAALGIFYGYCVHLYVL